MNPRGFSCSRLRPYADALSWRLLAQADDVSPATSIENLKSANEAGRIRAIDELGSLGPRATARWRP